MEKKASPHWLRCFSASFLPNLQHSGSTFIKQTFAFKMFFPNVSWPSVDSEADVQSSSSLPFAGVVLLLCLADLMLYADCLFIPHFIFQDVVAGFQLLSTVELQCAEAVSCRSSLHLLSQVVNVLGGLWENIRWLKILMIIALVMLRISICSSIFTSSGSVINKCLTFELVTDS